MKGLIFLVFFLVLGCSNLNTSDQQRARKRKYKGEAIERKQGEYTLTLQEPKYIEKENYPWEAPLHLAKITKEHFRCKGSRFHPVRIDTSDPQNIQTYEDCTASHGFPIVQGKQGVHPLLIHLVNKVQNKAQKRVVITSGYRCAVHNRYADPSKENQISKHQIGAEVDFYVKGWEESPEKVVQILIEECQKRDQGRTFHRLKREKLQTPIWSNGKVVIGIYQKEEGRDYDNRHPYPYLFIEIKDPR